RLTKRRPPAGRECRETYSGLETRRDELPSDLNEPKRAVQTDCGIVPQRHIEREPRFVTTCETAHRRLQQGPTDPPTSTILRHPEFRDDRRPLPMLDYDSAEDAAPIDDLVGCIVHELGGCTTGEEYNISA